MTAAVRSLISSSEILSEEEQIGGYLASEQKLCLTTLPFTFQTI